MNSLPSATIQPDQIVFICPDELHLNKIRKEHLRTTELHTPLLLLLYLWPPPDGLTLHYSAGRFCCQFNPVPNTQQCVQAPSVLIVVLYSTIPCRLPPCASTQQCPVCAITAAAACNPPGPTVFRAMGFIITIIHKLFERTNEPVLLLDYNRF